jgi:hypothetical protein
MNEEDGSSGYELAQLNIFRMLSPLDSPLVYDDVHRSFLRRRREWSERPTEAVTVLWWVRPGPGSGRRSHRRRSGSSTSVSTA